MNSLKAQHIGDNVDYVSYYLLQPVNVGMFAEFVLQCIFLISVSRVHPACKKRVVGCCLG